MALAQQADHDELERIALAHDDLLKIRDQSLAKTLKIHHASPLLEPEVALFYRAMHRGKPGTAFRV